MQKQYFKAYMSVHFMSVLLNMVSWVLIGCGIAYIIERFEGVSLMRMHYPLFVFISFIIGVFFSLQYAWPAFGISFNIFIGVCVGTILAAYGISQTLRKTALK